MPHSKTLPGRVLFQLRGGDRLRGRTDEQSARGFHLLLTAFLAWFALMESVIVPWFAANKVGAAFLILPVGGAALASLVLLRKSRTRAAATLFLVVMWCVLEVYTLFSGGVRSRGQFMVIVVVLDAGWLLGRSRTIAFASATLLVSFMEAIAELAGHTPRIYFPGAPLGLWAVQVVIVGLAVAPVVAFLDAQRSQFRALRDSEERFRSLSDASLEAVMIHDGRSILNANLSFARLFGYVRPEEMLGEDPVGLLLNPESQARIRERMERQATGVLEVTGVHKNGTEFSMETESRAIKYLGRDARIVTCRDLTERNRAVEAQRESEERYAALFDRSLDCVFLADFKGHFFDANKAALDLLGYRRDEIASLSYESLLTEDQVRTALQKDQQILTEGYKRSPTEYRLRRKDGGEVFVETQSSLIYRNGQPFAIQSIARDMTERKRAEEEKARLQAQLHQAGKMESVGRLAGGIAHDFNNLMTVINGYSDVLVRQLDSPARKYAEQIRKAGESAASLTRQLLAFSRMEVTRPEPVNLNDIVAESKDMLDRLVGDHIEITTSPEASPAGVLADPNQMNQCLMNLVVNARDAMPAGGQLTIETGNADVTPEDVPPGSGGRPGPHVRLTVRDTGIGMDETTRERIFEPFFTTKELGKGTGLGLSTVYGIVSQWQGFLAVGSEQGKGSEFSLYLPLSMTAIPPRAVPVQNAAMPSGGSATATILVVEDQESVREFVVECLGSSGYSVLQAANGAEALQIIGRDGGEIQLMMTDLNMPGMRGKELAARARTVLPAIRVLFMTGYAEDSARGSQGSHREDELIMKPFSPEALIGRIQGLLNSVPQPGT